MLTKEEVKKLMDRPLKNYDRGIIGRGACFNQSMEKCIEADPGTSDELLPKLLHYEGIIKEIMTEGDNPKDEDIVAEEKLDLPKRSEEDEEEERYLDRP